MRRFNLLLVGDCAETSTRVLRGISKVWKQNFLFESENLDEAQTLLRKLHVDLIMVDLDHLNVDLAQVASQFRDVRIVGTYSAKTRLTTAIHSEHRPVFLKENLTVDFLNYLKDLKKGKLTVTSRQVVNSNASFKDFRQLVTANA